MEIRTMEEACKTYRFVEERIAVAEEAHAAAIAKYKQALEQLQVIMRAMLNQAGVQSMNIPGLAEVKIVPKRAFGCADWNTFLTWLVVNNKPELLQQRIHEGNMQYWIDEQKKLADAGTIAADNILPPAVNVHTQNVIKILKGK
jgi:hypothetical protein